MTPRCRENGIPEHGRFIPMEIERIILQTETNIVELLPYFKDHESIGNYLNTYGGFVDLAIYRALVKEMVEPSYAMDLEMTLFRRTWCTFDYSVAELLVEGGKYQREHTLSDGDEVCDMRWFIQ